MNYHNTLTATFISRPNRFIAKVSIDGKEETVHVKNTGRCKELLIKGAAVVLERSANPLRKTRYDLIGVYSGGQLVNIDSQAPNKAAKEYLEKQYPSAKITPEYTRGSSRLDFLIQQENGIKLFVEVKGVTLLVEGEALFPDAPTQRGVKHINELISCVENGDSAMVLFIVQMKKAACLKPNVATHPAFGEALKRAEQAGVELRAVDCIVTEDTMITDNEIPVVLE